MSGNNGTDLKIEKEEEIHQQRIKEKRLKEKIENERLKDIEKRKQKKILEQKKKKEAELRRKQQQRRRRKTIILIIVLIIILFISIISIPIIPKSKLTLINSNYYSLNDFIDSKDKYNIYDIFKIKKNTSSKELIDKTNIDFKIKEKKIQINVVEKKIIGYNKNNKLEYLDKKNNIIESNITNIKSPVILNVSDDNKKLIAQELSNIPYKIRDEIVSIQNKKQNNKNNKIVELFMNDGNTIDIFITDIDKKMQYYDQIKNIIDQKGQGVGIIHLDIGDYYESKK